MTKKELNNYYNGLFCPDEDLDYHTFAERIYPSYTSSYQNYPRHSKLGDLIEIYDRQDICSSC